MSNQINIRQLLDKRGVEYYPYTHVSAVEGLAENGEFEAINDIQVTLDDLQAVVNQIPKFGSSGWMDISLLNGVTSFDSATTPQVQLMTIGDVRFMSVRGSFKGLTSDNQTIGQIPSSLRWAITKNVYFSQAMTTESGKAQFAAMKLDTNGVISIEESTRTTVTTGTWLTCDWTFML